jgi:hypothetical protein
MAAMTQDRLTQIRQRWQKTGQYFGQDGALAQDELLNHAARDMGYLLDLLTHAQRLSDALEPLLDNAQGYDKSNVRAAFLMHATGGSYTKRRDELLDLEERARHCWKAFRGTYRQLVGEP